MIRALFIMLFMLGGCGLKDTVSSQLGLTGQLKIVNNTELDAEIERQKCGSQKWSRLGTLKKGKDKTWTLDEQCYDLHATNESGQIWTHRALVQDGIRLTVFVEWN